MNIENLQKVLFECCSNDLCYYELQNTMTVLIINEYFGGDICKIYLDGIVHYFNLIENKIIDLTSSQFNHVINYNGYQIMDKQEILSKDIEIKYQTFKLKLIKVLLKQVDEKVYCCNNCNGLVDKFPNDATVFLGKDQTIVLVGEAPCK